MEKKKTYFVFMNASKKFLLDCEENYQVIIRRITRTKTEEEKEGRRRTTTKQVINLKKR